MFIKHKKSKGKKTNNEEISNPLSDLNDETKRDILGVLFFALATISILSFLGMAGGVGEKFHETVKILFGWGSLLLPIVLILTGGIFIKADRAPIPKTALLGIIIFTLAFLGILSISENPSDMKILADAGKGGGYLGIILAWPLSKLFEPIAGFIILLSAVLVSFLIIFNTGLKTLLGFLNFKSSEENEAEEINSEPEIFEEEKQEENLENNISPEIIPPETFAGKIKEFTKKVFSPPNFKIKSIGAEEEKEIETENDEIKIDDNEKENQEEKIEEIADSWKEPPINLLEAEVGKASSGDVNANANIIKRALENFGIKVEMGEIKVGPTVTQYTLRPAEGVKLSQITALQNDLSLALAAHPLRIEAPIPGKSLAGIEIPNKTVARVRLRNLIESPEFKNRKSNLSVILGRDVAGEILLANLEKMPHLLIAGATGSGKTVGLNNLIVGLLYQNSPQKLKLILIDPKRVEFTHYNGIPHLLTPVIVEPEKAVNALKWAIGEMDRRYGLLSEVGARDIFSYNDKQRRLHSGDSPVEPLAQKNNHNSAPQPSGNMEPSIKSLPFIVIVIDELADLMSTFPREIEASIVRLAQMARAVGIHLVVSTQRPSVEVITGLIKANITSRIAFEVASNVDSRTILDSSGAEKLLGNGDMLYVSSDISKPKRIQSAFVSEHEVKKVADYIKEQSEPEYKEEITKPAFEPARSRYSVAGGKESFLGENNMDDELYDDAKEIVIASEKASASLLQRRLRIGYARAARILDILEDRGIIGPADGARPRDVFIDNEKNDIIE